MAEQGPHSIDQIIEDRPADGSSRPRLGWKDRLASRVLRREAEGVVNGERPSPK